MYKKTKILLITLISLVSLIGLVSLALAQEWQEPAEAPPGGQVPAPINVGSDIQYKTGFLRVGSAKDTVPSEDGALVVKSEHCEGNCSCEGLPESACTAVGCEWKCFLAGTKISLADGQVKSIEDLEVGDKIKSYNLDEQKIVSSTVIALHKRESDHYYIINDNIRVTGEHPFYIRGEWIKVKDLRAGMKLFDGSKFIPVFSVKKVSSSVPVYNLTVNGEHNFFAQGILVHNKAGYKCSGTTCNCTKAADQTTCQNAGCTWATRRYGVYSLGLTAGVYGKDSDSTGYGYLGYGTWGLSAHGSSIGVRGTSDNTGIYGSTTSGDGNWAGYFAGNVNINGKLCFNNDPATCSDWSAAGLWEDTGVLHPKLGVSSDIYTSGTIGIGHQPQGDSSIFVGSDGVTGTNRTFGLNVHGDETAILAWGGTGDGVRAEGAGAGVYGKDSNNSGYGYLGVWDFGVFGSGDYAGVAGEGGYYGVYGQGSTTGVHGFGKSNATGGYFTKETSGGDNHAAVIATLPKEYYDGTSKWKEAEGRLAYKAGWNDWYGVYGKGSDYGVWAHGGLPPKCETEGRDCKYGPVTLNDVGWTTESACEAVTGSVKKINDHLDLCQTTSCAVCKGTSSLCPNMGSDVCWKTSDCRAGVTFTEGSCNSGTDYYISCDCVYINDLEKWGIKGSLEKSEPYNSVKWIPGPGMGVYTQGGTYGIYAKTLGSAEEPDWNSIAGYFETNKGYAGKFIGPVSITHKNTEGALDDSGLAVLKSKATSGESGHHVHRNAITGVIYKEEETGNWWSGSSAWGALGRIEEEHNTAYGVYGQGATAGVYGKTIGGDNYGYLGWNDYGVYGRGTRAGVYGRMSNVRGALAISKDEKPLGGRDRSAVYGWSANPSQWAGYFDGDVNVTGKLTAGEGFKSRIARCGSKTVAKQYGGAIHTGTICDTIYVCERDCEWCGGYGIDGSGKKCGVVYDSDHIKVEFDHYVSGSKEAYYTVFALGCKSTPNIRINHRWNGGNINQWSNCSRHWNECNEFLCR